MIFDQLTNVDQYKGIHQNLDTAIDFLLSTSLESLPFGRTEIDGNSVFVNKMEANTAPADTKQFEVHQRYIDIQIDLCGTERIDTATRVPMESLDFDSEKDIGFTDGEATASCILGPGNFTICMTKEPHKPGITVTEQTALVKCVLKVLI